MSDAKRIEFIDLAKGVCIIMVVVGHCGLRGNIPGWEIVRMPLYFILSGLFFKDYGGFLNLLEKKLNKLIVPFLFFYLLGCAFYYALKLASPALVESSAAKGILDLFNNRQFFNGPIWFLLALFWCNVLFCIISLNVKSAWLRILLVCFLGFLGWWMGNVQKVFLPLFFDVALTALPFFAFGYCLKRTPILFPNRYDRFNLLFAMASWAVAFLLTRTAHFRLSLHYNGLEGWATYLIAVSSVMSILFLCKAVRWLPVVSYLGRYSIVLLCVHHLIYRPLIVIFTKLGINPPNLLICVIAGTLILSALCIPICKRWLPWFVAQKDLIKFNK